MGEKETDSKYLVLWLCVFLTAGIIFTGWFVSLRHSFRATNDEMNSNVQKTFEQAQSDVTASFGEVEAFLDQEGKDLELDGALNQAVLKSNEEATTQLESQE